MRCWLERVVARSDQESVSRRQRGVPCQYFVGQDLAEFEVALNAPSSNMGTEDDLFMCEQAFQCFGIAHQAVRQFTQFFISMQEANYPDIEDSQIDSLSLHSVIVIRYNLEFMRERQLLTQEDNGSVLLTFEQHLTLFSDKLSAESLKFLRASLLNSMRAEVAA